MDSLPALYRGIAMWRRGIAARTGLMACRPVRLRTWWDVNGSGGCSLAEALDAGGGAAGSL
jgi:hypothetical protein